MKFAPRATSWWGGGGGGGQVEGRGERGGEREIEGYGRDMWEIWEGYENDMRWEGYEIDMRWRYDKDVTGVWEWYDV